MKNKDLDHHKHKATFKAEWHSSTFVTFLNPVNSLVCVCAQSLHCGGNLYT